MLKNLSYHVLLKDIEDQISNGWESVEKLENAMYERNSANDYYSEVYDAEETFFKSKLQRIYISLCLLLESLGYSSLLDDFKAGYKTLKPKLTAIELMPYGDGFYSKTLGYFWRYHTTLASLFGGTVEGSDERKQRNLFETILENTPKIVYDRGILPTSEAEVRKGNPRGRW